MKVSTVTTFILMTVRFSDIFYVFILIFDYLPKIVFTWWFRSLKHIFVRDILVKDEMHVGLGDILLKSEKVVITSGDNVRDN